MKVLDFVQLGGPKWMVGGTIFEMWLGVFCDPWHSGPPGEFEPLQVGLVRALTNVRPYRVLPGRWWTKPSTVGLQFPRGKWNPHRTSKAVSWSCFGRQGRCHVLLRTP